MTRDEAIEELKELFTLVGKDEHAARLRKIRVALEEGFEDDVSDTCEKCGCSEFLCGHNQRGY